jgi:hypothetical protein
MEVTPLHGFDGLVALIVPVTAVLLYATLIIGIVLYFCQRQSRQRPCGCVTSVESSLQCLISRQRDAGGFNRPWELPPLVWSA